MNINQRIVELGPGGLPRYNKKCNELTKAVNWLLGMTTSNGKVISDGGRGPVINAGGGPVAAGSPPISVIGGSQVRAISANYLLANNTLPQQIEFQQIDFDTANYAVYGDSANPTWATGFQMPANGLYLYGFEMNWGSQPQGLVRYGEAMVGSQIGFQISQVPTQSSLGIPNIVTASMLQQLNQGQIIEVFARHDANMTISTNTIFWCVQLEQAGTRV